ncbi:hypothetical protein [Kineosporia succinea]|uniref:Sporulation and spore germination protein n=1 Tax=Kineosporia succinea TaxID=84632 RepID=A0ABT9P8L2_9ACTN|nr:hypothetical protein [Kineosporia succinea]MDP9829029.1 hypothetical protein [Kineosporia succinea]
MAVVLLLAACGLQPTGPDDAGQAPTGISPGPTVYFLDSRQELQADVFETGRLGTVSDAVTLLLQGPGGSGLTTGIASTEVTRVEATVSDSTIVLKVPVAASEVSPRGIEQIVCTALANQVQSGGSPTTTVRIVFTIPSTGSDRPRTCSVLSPSPGRSSPPG